MKRAIFAVIFCLAAASTAAAADASLAGLIQAGDRDLALKMIAAGADVNASGGVQRATPLHMAARRGHVEIARALLDCGAAIDVRDRKGDTPIERAAHCRREGVVQLLMAHGASRAKRSGD